ncbi:hypothetical protein AB6H17_00770 [Proteus vulgaris]
MSERLGISILHYSQLENGHLKITVRLIDYYFLYSRCYTSKYYFRG